MKKNSETHLGKGRCTWGCWTIILSLFATIFTHADESTNPSYQEPLRYDSYNGRLSKALTAEFLRVQVPGSTNVNHQIWTRSYNGTIPGPTLGFNPGDQLRIALINNLIDPPSLPDPLGDSGEQDEMAHADQPAHHANIPHNRNHINLHTHGIHGSPKAPGDDVTIIIVPPDDPTQMWEKWYPKYMQARGWTNWHTITNGLTTAVSTNLVDYPHPGGIYVAKERFNYVFDIPSSHAPGTHWYHAHKHGATSVHVENGQAGVLIVRETTNTTILPELLNNTKRDHVAVIQEINNVLIQTSAKSKSKTPMIPEFPAPNSLVWTNNDQNPPPLITVNGEVTPEITINEGETHRFRLLSAGANNRAHTEFWLEPETAGQSANMHMAAYDGITMASLRTVSKKSRGVLAPGNRADLFVNLSAGNYSLIKTNYQTADPFKFYPRLGQEDVPKLMPLWSTVSDGAINASNPVPIVVTNGVIQTVSNNGMPTQADPQTLMKIKVLPGSSPLLTNLPTQADLTRARSHFANYLQPFTKAPTKHRYIYFDRNPKPAGDVVVTNKNGTTSFRQFTINSNQYNPGTDISQFTGNRPIYRGSEESWTIVNKTQSPHPFHIHVNPFIPMEVGQIIGVNITNTATPSVDYYLFRAFKTSTPNGPSADTTAYYYKLDKATGQWTDRSTTPPAALKITATDTPLNYTDFLGRWQDVAGVPAYGYLKIYQRFLDFDGESVFHCHILRHEDRGMMMNFKIVPPPTP